MSGNIEKLPKWAQDEIFRLRASRGRLQDELAAGIAGDRTHADSLHLADPRSDRGGHMPSRFRDGRFMLGGLFNDFVDFRMDQPHGDGHRRVYIHSGTSTLIVEPRAANAILLRIKE